MEVGRLGRPRKEEGTRYKDKFTNIMVNNVPMEIYDKLKQEGKPSEVILQMLIQKFQKLG